MSDRSTTTLTMTRTIGAEPERVFEAWTDPEMMKQWLFTMEVTNKVCRNDLQVGGTWEIVDEREGTEYRATGEYLDIEPPHRLAFTFQMPQMSDTEDRIEIEIAEREEASQVSLEQQIVVSHGDDWTDDDVEEAHKEFRETSERTWSVMFDALEELLETGSIDFE